MRKQSLLPFLVLLLSTQWLFSQIPNGYYNSATGLSGAPLKTALFNIIKGHTVVSYSGLWNAFYTTDDKPNGKVWDMYSDIPNGTPPYEYTFGSNQCGNYSGEGDCYNREHSFPQSWFGEASPMVSDLFHIYPTDGYVNSMRSNYPFGEVNSPTWTSLNGSKRGPSASPGYTSTVFEPRDEYKGDFARSYFYMATRYENVIASWQNNTGANEVLNGTSYPCYDQWFLDVLLAWHIADPVSQKEIDRNNTVYYSFQNNRNPYIDHPEYVSSVWGGTTVLPEPSNHVLAFTAGSATTSTLSLTWNDNDGAQPAEKFLVLANITGNFTSPADGTPVADDLNMSDNSGAANINHGVQSCTWTGLTPGTLYYFKIWPYTNSAANTNYKTDGSVPQTSGTTLNSATLTANPSSLSGFSYVTGSGPSASQFYVLSGSNLTPASGNITITGSADYEVSVDNSIFSTVVNAAYTGGTLTAKNVYVRLKAGLAAGNYNNQLVVNSGGGAPAANVTCSGSVTSAAVAQINITSPAVMPGNVTAGTDNHILYISKFDVSVLATTLQQIQYQVNGTYTDTDIKANGFQLYGGSTNNFATAVPVGTPQSSNLGSTGGLLTFASLNTAIAAGNTLYIWLTSDISGSAVLMHTLATAATTNASYIFTAGNKTGTQSAGGVQTITGPTFLSPGDIAFTAYQTDDPDKFAFVLLKDLPTATSIRFTDNAWEDNELLSTEGILTWSAPASGLPKGTIVTVSLSGSPTVTAGSISQSGNFQLSASGDQILAYQGDHTSPLFISGISSGGWLTTGNVNSNTSYLPPTLTLYANTLGFTTETDNGYYSGPQTATAEALRALLNFPANYTRLNEISAFPAWTFPLAALTIIDINSEVQDITIPASQSLTINAGKWFTVHGTLTNNSGTAGLIIKSELTGTGSLIHNTNAVEATMQRYISGDPDPNNHYYHLVSIPLVQSGSIVSGLFSGSYLFQFNESAGTPNTVWTPLGNATGTPLSVNQGYRLYYPLGSGVTYNHAGELNNGTFEVPVNHTDDAHGFNLVPNPYPSAINWDAGSGWTRASLAGSIWTWKQNTGNYAAYVKGTSTLSGTPYIPAGQSFFVQSISNQPFSMNNNVRIHSNELFTKQSDAVENTLRLNIEANNYTDEILLRFNDTATASYDLLWDALKLSGSAEAPQLAMVTDDSDLLSISSMPYKDGEIIIPLHFTLNASGMATFTGSGMESFDPLTTIYLEDQALSKLNDLRANPEYGFSYQAGSAADRFRLRISMLTSLPENPEAMQGTAFFNNGYLYLKVPEMEGQLVEINIFNSLGILADVTKMSMQGTIKVPAPQAGGMYIVRVFSGNKYFVCKLIHCPDK